MLRGTLPDHRQDPCRLNPEFPTSVTYDSLVEAGVHVTAGLHWPRVRALSAAAAGRLPGQHHAGRPDRRAVAERAATHPGLLRVRDGLRGGV